MSSRTPQTSLQQDLSQHLLEVQQRIDAAARQAGRAAGDIRLIAVSKTVNRAAVDAAYAAGAREFGENRVQDALEKFTTEVPDDLRLHMIGSVQTNKARQIVGKFDLIHSVDRASLIKELEKRAAAHDLRQPILLQVNVGREEQKHGCEVEDVDSLIDQILGCEHLELRGFMTMAPLVADPERARGVFAEMREIAARAQTQYPDVQLDTLSMGMTNDFEVAIAEGATMVRIGRAIFQPGSVD